MNKNNIKNLSWRIITTVIITLTAVFTVWVYAAFVEPTAGPNNSDQDFVQNILGANNDDNDFDSSNVAANKDGSIIERLEYINVGFEESECGESTTATQTDCYIDDTARYLTTDLCNETKENQCFVPTDNSYYAFGSECADSTTTTKTNCYVDDTAKYVDSSICSAASNLGYCFINTATFSAMDSDLAAGKIKSGVVIFGITGTLASAQSNPDYPDSFHIASFIEPSSGPADYDQDFTQNIIGANNADNDFDSSLVASSSTGSIVERLEHIIYNLENSKTWYQNECGESTTATQTSCYIDDTSRYITTDLCNEAKENACFVPTDNSYYAFNTECSDSTTSTQTNCYVDDTARYVDSNVCSAASNDGYCYINTTNLSDIDTDLVASNIKYGVVIFGITGTKTLTNGSTCSLAAECTSGYCVDGYCCNTSCSGSTCQRCDSYSVSGAGTCGYVSSSAQDPDSECTVSGCANSGNCSGNGYSCGYTAADTQDAGCTGCYWCNGSGSCALCGWSYGNYYTPTFEYTGTGSTRCKWSFRNQYGFKNWESYTASCDESMYSGLQGGSFFRMMYFLCSCS